MISKPITYNICIEFIYNYIFTSLLIELGLYQVQTIGLYLYTVYSLQSTVEDGGAIWSQVPLISLSSYCLCSGLL